MSGDLAQLARALDPKAKRAGNGSWSCRCPAHEDAHASLSLSLKDGRLLWRCHSGCSQEEVQVELQKRGLLRKANGADHTAKPRAKADQSDDWRPIMPIPDGTAEPAFTHPIHCKPSRTWTYRAAGGELLFHVARFDPPGERKQILPRSWGSWNGRLGWYWRHPATPRPLYRLDQLAARPGDPVLLVEGEKSADAAAELLPDFVATTWPGGSSATGQADWSALKGRQVWIWPDHDEPGRKAATAIGDALLAIAAGVWIVDPPADLPDRWDLADPAPDGLDVRELLAHAERHLDRLERLVEEAESDPGAPFESESVDFLAALRERDKAAYERARARLKKTHVRVAELDQEVERRKPEVGEDGAGKGRALDLPEPQPWGEPVAGVLDDLLAAIRRYVSLDEHKALAVALWCVHAHCMEWAYIAPRLHVTSPAPNCGKTILLDSVARLVPRPLLISNISPAGIFRTVEACRPCMLVDEFDAFGTDDEQLRGLVNCGHTRTSAFVIRVVDIGGTLEPRRFSTWGALAVAGIGKVPATIASRSIVIEMERKLPGDRVARLTHRSGHDLDVLCRKIARWAADNRAKLEAATPNVPAQLSNRDADNWAELLSIAALHGDDWAERARRAALSLTRTDFDDAGYGIALLEDIKTAIGKAEQISTDNLLKHIHAMTERPWGEYGRQRKPITPRQLATLLRPFGVASGTLRDGDVTYKGYRREQFESAWTRYLSVTASQARESATFGDSLSVTPDPDVTDRNGEKARQSATCDGVTDREAPGASKPFVVGTDWADVPPGVVLPPGCEIRMDMSSGAQQARKPSAPHIKRPCDICGLESALWGAGTQRCADHFSS